jgi:ribosomal protein L39E
LQKGLGFTLLFLLKEKVAKSSRHCFLIPSFALMQKKQKIKANAKLRRFAVPTHRARVIII